MNAGAIIASGRPKARRRWLPRRARLRVWIVSILLTAVCLVWIYPFLWMMSAAVKTDAEIFSGLGLMPQEFHWENFRRAWTVARIGRYFWNSVITSAGSVAIVVSTTAMIGYVLGRYPFPGKRVIVGALVAVVFLPEGYTIIPVFDLINALGLSGSLWGVILGLSGGAHVVMILLFAGYFSQLPRELEEAAVVDGAGFLRVFLQIMLPLARPVLATGIILQFMHSWNAFLLPMVLTLANPDLRTLAVGMYAFRGQYFTDWSGMAAAATISLLPIIVVFLLFQRWFVEGIAGSVRQ
ncbi:MAG: carbohydrate ABC transporter permease [Thermomicrobiales bacterium]